ncbi:MAG: diaminopimelate epimerase [Actinobacteria bacterium]|nr:diaminopimelate epimerase [Actinomycetota bacterium]
MQFTKMQGIGNDYVYVNCFEESVEQPEKLALAVADRHFGIGSDGLILICPSEQAEARMQIFNADGSEAEMCGNGIRCVAKYVYEHGIAKKNPLKIETGNGILTIELTIEHGKVAAGRVNMGEPILEAAKIPMAIDDTRAINYQIEVAGLPMTLTCLSMGNPHAILFVDDVANVAIEKLGPVIENHRLFPQRTNVHWVQVVGRNEVIMRTWERGAGITLACGTGASAVGVAGVLTEQTDRKITAHLPGGDLQIEWNESGNCVYMTGPAVEVFSGTWPETNSGQAGS